MLYYFTNVFFLTMILCLEFYAEELVVLELMKA